ncbi:hypothetical protein COV06_03540 [Candidatus Uhrbacteria bacterium CG10_big_fil_rev_8_21_14_0_10_50_16]|uniref:Type II secretion system protein GspF domain-containing protein n=1 Tax=Candidatus Uhrbacteria bacterium CG10_big_fil_rev_8_21_14_0_10_50_16 TaxID=1975039 RepID=A0A2H0RM30_9BACT|nr:MAG: hypothetical protein COV06_03540 [Candidatus Uhrbacteria bacterium CG10_big_fil_rev_8_21_14_0_10_50_16]
MRSSKTKLTDNVGKIKKPQPLWLQHFTVRLSHVDRLMFTKYLAVLLRSGIPIGDALEIIGGQTKAGPLKTVLDAIEQSIQDGNTLSSGFAKFPWIFDSVYVNLIAAGEASGTLQQNLDHLTEQKQKEHELVQKVRGALMYPIVILIGGFILSIGIVVFILPNVVDVFKTLNVQLPWTTRVLLGLASFINEHGFLTLAMSVGFVAVILGIRKIRALQPFFHKALMYIPVFGSIVRYVNLTRMTRLLGTMLQSGSTMGDALPIATTVLKNAYYRGLMVKLEGELKRGRVMASEMAKYPRAFPPMMTRMTRVGEESGLLGEMMGYLADFYEQEVDDMMRNLSNLLEPILLVIIGVMVAVLALSVISPIYQVVGAF